MYGSEPMEVYLNENYIISVATHSNWTHSNLLLSVFIAYCYNRV